MKRVLCVILTLVLLIGLLPVNGLLPLVNTAKAAPVTQALEAPAPQKAQPKSADPIVKYPRGKFTTSDPEVTYQDSVVVIDTASWGDDRDRELGTVDRLFNSLRLSTENGIKEIKTDSLENKIKYITLEVNSFKGLMIALFWSQFYNDGLFYQFIKPDDSDFTVNPDRVFIEKCWSFRNEQGENHVDPYPLDKNCIMQIVLVDKSIKTHAYTFDWTTIISEYQRLIYSEIIYPKRKETKHLQGDFFNYYGCSDVVLQMKEGDIELWMHRNNNKKAKYRCKQNTFFAIGEGNRLSIGGYSLDNKLKLHCETTYNLNISNTLEDFGSAEVYYGPTMCYLDGGNLDLSNGIFETSSRAVDRHPYKNGIVKVGAYVKGKPGSGIVKGNGGTLRAIQASMRFHLCNQTTRILWGTWEDAHMVGNIECGISGTFDSVLLEDSTLYAKNGRDAPQTDGAYWDLSEKGFHCVGMDLENAQLTMIESEVRDCGTWLTDCDINLQGCTFNTINKYNSYGKYGDKPSCYALKLRETGGFIERTIIAAEGKWARGLGAYQSYGKAEKKLTIQDCDIASEKSNAYFTDDISANILDTNLLVKEKNPYLACVAGGFQAVFGAYREDEHVSVYYLSPDGDRIGRQELVKDLQPMGNSSSPLPMPMATGGKTTKRLQEALGGKTFGDVYAKYLQGIQEFYNYDSWYMAHISGRYKDDRELPPLKPSKLEPGKNWGVYVNDGWKHTDSESFSLDRKEMISLWLDNPDALSGDYTRIHLEQKLPDGKWIYAKKNAFYGPNEKYDIDTVQKDNYLLQERLYCAEIPRTAPGVYCFRFAMEHVVSGIEYSDPVFITVEPYAQEITTLYLHTDLDRSWSPAEHAFLLKNGTHNVMMYIVGEQLDILREFNDLYGMARKHPGPMTSPDGIISTGKLESSTSLSYTHPAVSEPTRVSLNYTLRVNQPRTSAADPMTGTLSPRCYGAGELDLPAFELPVQYGYTDDLQQTGVGRKIDLLFLPKKAEKPGISNLGVCDAVDSRITFVPEYAYDIFEDSAGNVKLDTSGAVNIHMDDIRMNDGVIHSIYLESFAQPYDLNNLDLEPDSSFLLVQGTNVNESMGVKVGVGSQYLDNCYTNITDFSSRIPANLFKAPETRDWYLTVEVASTGAPRTAYHFKLMQVNRAGNFQNLSVNLETVETVLPLNWDGSVMTVISGPTQVKATVSFDGIPVDADYLDVRWYRQLPASFGSGVPVFHHTVRKGDEYCLEFAKDTILDVDKGHCTFAVPTTALVGEDIRNHANTVYEYYAVVKYMRNGVTPSAAADSRYRGTGRSYKVRIDGFPSPRLEMFKYTGYPLTYIPSDITGYPDIYPSKLPDSAAHPGTFENPLNTEGFWEYLVLSKSGGYQKDTYRVDWIVSDAYMDYGAIYHTNSRIVHTQESTRPEQILGSVTGIGAYCQETGDGKENITFAYKFLQSRELAVRPGNPRVQRVTGTNGTEYARALFAVQPVITWTGKRGGEPMEIKKTVQPPIYCYSQIPYTAYETAVNSQGRMPGADTMEIRFEKEYPDTQRYYYGPLATSKETFYANEPLTLALRMEVQGGGILSRKDISNIYVDWYSVPFKSSTAGMLLCTNEYSPELFRKSGTIIDLYAKNILGENHLAYPTSPYIYAVLRAHDSTWNVDYVTRSETITIPNFVEPGGEMFLNGVKVNNRYTAYSRDLLPALPAPGTLKADAIPDELLMLNTDPIHLDFGKNIPDGQHGFIEVALVRADNYYNWQTVLCPAWDCTNSRTVDIPPLSELPLPGKAYLGEVPMLLKFTYFADTDGSLTTTADRGRKIECYLPIKITSANVYPPEMDRTGLPTEYYCHQTADSTADTPVYGCYDWLSPGKVTFGKHPATQWDPQIGRRLALCYYFDVNDDVNNTFDQYYIPVVEMMLTENGFEIAPDQTISESKNHLYFVNDSVLDPKDREKQHIYQQVNPWAGKQCTEVRKDGSVMLKPQFFKSMLEAGLNGEIRLAFVAVSTIQPLDENTITVAATAGDPFTVWNTRISIISPEIDPEMPKSDFIGVFGNSGTKADGRPSASLKLPNGRFNPYVLYTWYAYNLADNTLLPLGDQNVRATLENVVRDGEQVTLAHMPLRGHISPTLKGEYEVICGYEYHIEENFDGGIKVWYGACGVTTANNQVPVFADAENQTPISTYMDSFTPEDYKQLRQSGIYGTNVRFQAPANAAVPNYLPVATNPTIASHSLDGVEIRWSWSADTVGIGEISVSYVVTDAQGNQLNFGQLTNCGKSVILPVYNAEAGSYTVSVTAVNRYLPSDTSATQTFTADYTVTPSDIVWKPVILPIESFDVTQELLRNLEIPARLDRTNADDGSINYLWEYENAGSYSKISTSQVLTGTAMQNAGINSVGAYHIRLTVTNTGTGGKTEAATELFTVNVVDNIHYAVSGTVVDEQSMSPVEVKLFDNAYASQDILDGKVMDLGVDAGLDAEPPQKDANGNYIHTYTFHLHDGMYKIGFFREGCEPAIRTVTVDGSNVTVEQVTMLPGGASVSGTITSYHSETDPVTVKLMQEGNPDPAAEVTVTGNSAGYSLEHIKPGTYTLIVSKYGHVTREYPVTVGTSAVTQDVEICLLGDVNGDGKISSKDLSKIRYHIIKEYPLTGYELECADVNHDGKISSKDMSKIRYHILKEYPLW